MDATESPSSPIGRFASPAHGFARELELQVRCVIAEAVHAASSSGDARDPSPPTRNLPLVVEVGAAVVADALGLEGRKVRRVEPLPDAERRQTIAAGIDHPIVVMRAVGALVSEEHGRAQPVVHVEERRRIVGVACWARAGPIPWRIREGRAGMPMN